MAAHARLRAAGLGQGRRRVPRTPDQRDVANAGAPQRARRLVATEHDMTDLMRPDVTRDQDEVRLRRPAERPRRRRSAMILAGSLLAGLVAAIALVLGPFAARREAVITGAILLGFAAGW